MAMKCDFCNREFPVRHFEALLERLPDVAWVQ